MIKKIFLFTVAFFIVLSHSSLVHAQEVPPSATPTPTPVDYTLPYPGILPGHPFYFLKEIRDKIAGFLISNPLKKAEFDLLQADKNLSASTALFDQNKTNPAIFTTLTKANDSFSEAIVKTNEAILQGNDGKDLMNKLLLANRKQQEVIVSMVKKADKEEKKKFVEMLKKAQKSEKKLKALHQR